MMVRYGMVRYGMVWMQRVCEYMATSAKTPAASTTNYSFECHASFHSPLNTTVAVFRTVIEHLHRAVDPNKLPLGNIRLKHSTVPGSGARVRTRWFPSNQASNEEQFWDSAQYEYGHATAASYITTTTHWYSLSSSTTPSLGARSAELVDFIAYRRAAPRVAQCERPTSQSSAGRSHVEPQQYEQQQQQ